MKTTTVLSLNSCAGRLGMAPNTLKARCKARGIAPDTIVINGGKAPLLCFDVDRLGQLRSVLCPTNETIS